MGGGIFIMLINVLDKDLKVVAFIDNEVPNLPNYYEDEFNEYLDSIGFFEPSPSVEAWQGHTG